MKAKRITACLMAILLLVTLFVPTVTAKQAVSFDLPKETALSAQAALVVHLAPSAERDAIIYQKNAVAPLAPAGLVRVMVGITALTIANEKKLDLKTATGTYTDACYQAIAGTGIPTAGMLEGDIWTLQDLLTISTIHSAGDVVEALVMALADNEAAFVSRMNQIAVGIGCENTRFKNVHGLDDPEQVSTVTDIYRILRYAIDQPVLNEILSLTHYTVSPKKGADTILPTTNNLLRVSTDSYYEPAILGRAGWSDLTGPSLAAVARVDGYEYMVVVMGCDQKEDTAHYADAKTLFRWAYRDFILTTLRTKNDPIASVPVALSDGADRVQLVPKEDVTAVIPTTMDASAITVKTADLPAEMDAPIEKGTVCGKAIFYTPDGQPLIEVDLVADQAIERSQWLFIWDCIVAFFTSGWFWGIFLSLIALISGYVALTIQHNKKRRQQQARRRGKRNK